MYRQKFIYKTQPYKIVHMIILMMLTTWILTACMQVQDTPNTGEVSMVGIDYNNKEYRVTVQLASRSTTNLQKPNYYQGKGQTVGGALQAAELKSGSKLIWDGLKVIAIGKQAAVNNADASLLALGAKVQINPQTLVAVVEPSAERIIRGERSAKGIDASKVEMRLQEGMRKQITPESRMSAFIKAAEEKSGGKLISYVVSEISNESDTTLEIAGSGVFYQNTLFALLDPQLTQTVLNIGDKPRQMDMQMVGNKFDLLSGVIKKSKVKLVPVMNDGKLSFIVSLSFDGGSVNVSDGDTMLENEPVSEKFPLTIQGFVAEKISNALKLTASIL